MQRTMARDAFLDNAKAILISLVVIGHLLEGVALHSSDDVYKWIYLFHMPAFVFISGYLSRNFRATPRQAMGIVTNLLIPYTVVVVVMSLERLALGHPFSLNLFIPTFAIWYLLALAIWRLATPVLRVIPHPVLIATLISVASVTYGGIGSDLAGARVLSFLPFFTAGLFVTPERVEAFKQWSGTIGVRLIAAVFLVGAFVVIFLFRAHIARSWLYMYGKYDEFGLSTLQNITVRVVVLASATVMMLAFLAWVPRRRTLFTYLGASTLFVYVLQTVILYPLLDPIAAWEHWSVVWLLLIPAGAGLALVLGSRPVQRWSRWFVDPAGTIPWVRNRLAAQVERAELQEQR